MKPLTTTLRTVLFEEVINKPGPTNKPAPVMVMPGPPPVAAGASIVVLSSASAGSGDWSVMILPAGMEKVIVSAPGVLACVMAARNEPAPLSFVLVTVIVPAHAERASGSVAIRKASVVSSVKRRKASGTAASSIIRTVVAQRTS